MTLIPSQNRPLPNAEPSMETTLETQILSEIKTVGRKVDDLIVLRTVLMGDPKVETPHGRLPKVESQVDDHESRLTKIEATHIRWKAYLVAVGAVAGVVGSVMGAGMALIAQGVLSHLGMGH